MINTNIIKIFIGICIICAIVNIICMYAHYKNGSYFGVIMSILIVMYSIILAFVWYALLI